MDRQQQELNTTLQFQSDLVRLLNSLSAMESDEIPSPDEILPRQEPVTL